MNLDIIIYIFIAVGFFAGILRGVKKEFFTLISLIGAFACVLFACVPLANILNNQINLFDIGIVKTICEYIGVSANGLVYLLVGGLLFFITYLVLSIVFKKLIFSTKRQAKGKAKDGSRFLGGLVGLFSGLVLGLFFVPLFCACDLFAYGSITEVILNQIPFLSEKLSALKRLSETL